MAEDVNFHVGGTKEEWLEALRSYRAVREAAPELLEALKDAPEPYEYMSKADFKALPYSMRSFVDAHRTWLIKARAAISAARGESQ